LNRIAVYIQDIMGIDEFINEHLQKMKEFIENSFGDNVAYDVFVDKKCLNRDRTELNRLMNKIRAGQYTTLAVPNMNRTLKVEYDMKTYGELLSEFELYGVEILELPHGSVPQVARHIEIN